MRLLWTGSLDLQKISFLHRRSLLLSSPLSYAPFITPTSPWCRIPTTPSLIDKIQQHCSEEENNRPRYRRNILLHSQTAPPPIQKHTHWYTGSPLVSLHSSIRMETSEDCPHSQKNIINVFHSKNIGSLSSMTLIHWIKHTPFLPLTCLELETTNLPSLFLIESKTKGWD